MAILRMAKDTWPPCQGRETCRFGDATYVILLNTSACYARQLIQLEKHHNLSLAERFRAGLCKKRAIVREGTSYPSNWGPMDMIILG